MRRLIATAFASALPFAGFAVPAAQATPLIPTAAAIAPQSAGEADVVQVRYWVHRHHYRGYRWHRHPRVYHRHRYWRHHYRHHWRRW